MWHRDWWYWKFSTLITVWLKIKIFMIIGYALYSGTSFIRHLDYPDKLNSATYINTHAQRAWLMTFWGYGHSWSRSLEAAETYPGQNWLTYVVVWTLLTMLILHRYGLKTRHHISGEKTKHFSYPDCFTYPVCQHQGFGQRGPDNRGCTVDPMNNGYWLTFLQVY